MSLIDRTFRLADDAKGAGVNCTLEGVSLAGAPLLRKTLGGLQPRPAGELAGLMKAAYGRDVDPGAFLPGLGVIADALNHGDIGRAMIASVQLRLPDVSPRGAANIAKAQGAFAKFNPDEPRDARGRWTIVDEASADGGGADGDETPNGGMQLIPVSDFGAANDNTPPSIESWIVVTDFTRGCIENATEPGFYDKVQECTAAHDKIMGLVKLGWRSPKSQFWGEWPDGSAVIIKFGEAIPERLGHKF